MNGWRQGAYYVAKYIAKDTEEAYWDMEHGRHWGVRNWAMLPVHQVVVALSAVEFFAMRRWVKLFRQARGVRTRDLGKALPFCHQAVAGITMFLGAPDVLRMLRCLHGRALAMPRSLK
jgi:hypothetical protein